MFFHVCQTRVWVIFQEPGSLLQVSFMCFERSLFTCLCVSFRVGRSLCVVSFQVCRCRVKVFYHVIKSLQQVFLM